MKSKVSAIRMISDANASRPVSIASAVFHNDVLQRVRHVLTTVGRGLQELVDLLVLQHPYRIFFVVEQFAHGAAQNAVDHLLQPVDLDTVLEQLFVPIERLERKLKSL